MNLLPLDFSRSLSLFVEGTQLQNEIIASDPGGNNGQESYTYDAVGNRKTLTSTILSLSGSMSYNYDNNDCLTTDTYDNDGEHDTFGRDFVYVRVAAHQREPVDRQHVDAQLLWLRRPRQSTQR